MGTTPTTAPRTPRRQRRPRRPPRRPAATRPPTPPRRRLRTRPPPPHPRTSRRRVIWSARPTWPRPSASPLSRTAPGGGRPPRTTSSGPATPARSRRRAWSRSG
ncbi:hypothetical protein E7Z54_20350 [Nocardioides sp.]|nr:hypothetical protein E7Z54_20350 [Nocardioides sp.]